MSDNKHSGNATWGSRFGYIMVAAGAAIGLGNVWKFPYLAYRGGGAVFLVTYILVAIILAKPMLEMESAIGRQGKSDTVSVFEKINRKWGFVGWISNICTLMINFYYVIVGGWVLRYALQFIVSGKFGDDANEYFQRFITDPLQPIIWGMVLLGVVVILLFFGITNYVERVSKVILPALAILLLICGIYACFVVEGAAEGLKYYILPDFSKFSFKVFADAVTQVLFSVGIGWGIFTTLGANLSEKNNIRADASLVGIADTAVAILAGFVIIPAAYGAGVDIQKGPALIFDVMANIFSKLPLGRLFGAMFFVALTFAVISSLFSFIEISVRTFEIKLGMGRKKAITVSTLIISIGNILVSLGFSSLSFIKLPWPSVGEIAFYNLYDWFDCFSGYVLLPLGCLLICIFTSRVWKWDAYENEVTSGGRDGRVTIWNKVNICLIIPMLMVIVLLNVFGVIK